MRKNLIVILPVLLLALLLAACNRQAAETGTAEQTPQAEAGATAEATTPEAGIVAEEADTTPVVLGICDVADPSQLSINTIGLGVEWQANCVEATPYDASQPPGPTGLPQHIQINFNNLSPETREPQDPVIYVIPVEQYRALWDAAGNPTVGAALDELKELIASKPESVPTSGNPLLPMELVGGVNDLAVQGKYMDFGAWDGVRYVGRWAQDANPVTNQGLRYVFQGFAGENDELLVVAYSPVTTVYLPDTAGDVSDEAMAAFNADPQADIAEQAAMLNELTAADWAPNLELLDAVVGSLQYGGPEFTEPLDIVLPVEEAPKAEESSRSAGLQGNFGTVTAPAGVNIRFGPGTAYPIFGLAPFGSQWQIIGRSADGLWWVIPVAGMPNSQGWVSTQYMAVPGDPAVPVIPAPPLPQPTATPLPAITATPGPTINFWADRTTINAGECTTLRWDVQNIQAVWVYPQGQPYQNFPATGQGSRQVCPSQTTTYEMRVLLTDGSVVTRQITITVNPVGGGGGGGSLPNTSWGLASLGGQPILSGTNPTIIFGPGNFLEGFGGCNTFSGNYSLFSNNGIAISIAGRSGASCGEAVDQQESLYLAGLQGAGSYNFSGGQLVIFDTGGRESLRFNRR